MNIMCVFFVSILALESFLCVVEQNSVILLTLHTLSAVPLVVYDFRLFDNQYTVEEDRLMAP